MKILKNCLRPPGGERKREIGLGDGVLSSCISTPPKNFFSFFLFVWFEKFTSFSILVFSLSFFSSFDTTVAKITNLTRKGGQPKEHNHMQESLSPFNFDPYPKKELILRLGCLKGQTYQYPPNLGKRLTKRREGRKKRNQEKA
eukprot:TRINITY_DN6523_c1_g1_i1.p1 TRINITY_DN6523_c1_g1~~TRINITY_DN6523_c1_g1_i1.p1  ORF type:complete len:143 (-),score=0.39 TRINITY_DN6523_c1_g1_i1:1393-1821(-)